jgi:hypothetical protein
VVVAVDKHSRRNILGNSLYPVVDLKDNGNIPKIGRVLFLIIPS